MVTVFVIIFLLAGFYHSNAVTSFMKERLARLALYKIAGSTWLITLVAICLVGSPIDTFGQASKLEPTPVTAEEALLAGRDPDLLVMAGGMFDPKTEVLSFERLGFEEASVGGSYGIVQFKRGQSQKRWEIEGADVEFLGYIPHNAYQVRWTESGRQLLESHSAVRWVGDYPPGLKVSPELWPGKSRSDFSEVALVGFKGVELKAIIETVTAVFPGALLTAVVPEAPQPHARLRVAAKDLDALVRFAANIEDVAWIEPWRQPRLRNSHSVSPIQANESSGVQCPFPSPPSTPIWDQDLIGSNQIIAIADSGLDRNECWFTEFDDGTVSTSTVTDFDTPPPPAIGALYPDRKVVAYWVQPGASPYDDNQTCPGGSDPTSFHGTHVAGIAAGDCGLVSSPSDPQLVCTDYDGMAPNAQILFQDLGNDTTGCLSGLDNGLGGMFQQAYSGGARIHSNSWGAEAHGAYGVSDQMTDKALWVLEGMLGVFAAGNTGAAQGTVSPGNAKNALTVGALGQGSSTMVAGFSSRGPTQDGRIKPDIMAPGSSIESAQGNDNDITLSAANTQILDGTSMATPAVAGAAALLRQYFTDGFYPTGIRAPEDARAPSGALMKAMLLNGTSDVAQMPNFDAGWGRVWLDNNLYFAGELDARRVRVWTRTRAVGIRSGESHVYEIDVPSGSELRVTLVWFDPAPTLGSGIQLVNNLDLEVTAPGSIIYQGNVIVGGESQTGGIADALNTVEQVRLTAPTAGIYSLRVHAASVPGTADLYSDWQGYALVASYGDLPSGVGAAPASLTATDNNTTGIDLSFDSVSGATVYNIYRADGDCSTADPEAFELVGTTSSTTFTDIHALGGQTYAYRVRAADGCCEGPLSTCASAESTAYLLCSQEVDVPPRPYWQDVLGPNDHPDYQDISENFNIFNTLELLASIVTKSITKIEDLSSQADLEDSKGVCVCSSSASPVDDKTRDECKALCTSDPLIWLPSDIFNDSMSAALFALEYIGWLDDLKIFLDENTGELVEILEDLGSGIENVQEIADLIAMYVDRFSEGYHLGAYGEQRPDLHQCVGFAGHGVTAELLGLLDGDVSIGGGYTSHQLSDRHRAQFRSGGFRVKVFGKPFQLLPGIEANLQIDGFRLWDAQKPFNLDFSNGHVPIADIESYDVFHLVDSADLAALDNGDEVLEPGELLVKDFYPVEYTPEGSSAVYQWPRSSVDQSWEGPSIAVLSAGLNLPLKMKELFKAVEPPIPIGGVFTLQPFFRLNAGAEWIHQTNKLRDRVQDKVNLHLVSEDFQLDETDFARDMHFFQADDVTGDNGTSVYIQPEIGMKLNANVGLAKWLALSLGVNVSVGARVEPGAYGGIADLNTSLMEALLTSNPPDEPCEARKWDENRELACSNTDWPESTGDYICTDDDDDPGDQDGDQFGDGIQCQDRGYCGSFADGVFTIAQHDVTSEQCAGGDGSGGEGDSLDLWYVPYHCAVTYDPVPTAWSGEGCHPLTTGFPSACACIQDDDCLDDESCQDGLCLLDTNEASCGCESTSDCAPSRACVEGACLANCLGDAQCRDGEICDPGLGVCVSEHGLPFAEQIAYRMKNNNDAPRHAVWTYALSEIEMFAFLSAGLDLKMMIKVWRKRFERTIFEISKWWELASALKGKYQVGLEAQYQNDCAPDFGLVSNRQPGSDWVDRYNPQHESWDPSLPMTHYSGNAGSWDDLVDWCKPEIPLNKTDPDAPTNEDLAANLEDLLSWGEDIGLDLWGRAGLCVGEITLTQWLDQTLSNPENLYCSIDLGTSIETFRCLEVTDSLLTLWGCLDVDANVYAQLLADHFNGIDNFNIVTNVDGTPVFDLGAILIDPNEEISQDNIKPEIFHYSTGGITNVGQLWAQLLEQCFDQNAQGLNDVYLDVPELGPCCGNGVLNGREQCDDGNNLSGDGCSPLCGREVEELQAFTDREAWEKMAGEATCERLDNEVLPPNGTAPTPFTTADGTSLAAISAPPEILVQYLNPGSINGSGELHFRDFARGLRVMPQDAVTAIGFDYATAGESWAVEADGRQTTLPSQTTGFVGFVTDDSIDSFDFYGDVGSQDGISIDNFCYVSSPSLQAGDLYTVTDENVLAAVDIGDDCSATMIGVTKDSDGTIRRIRGLAYDHAADILYGITREGHLVTVDRASGRTTPIPLTPPLSGNFWGGLAFDDTTGLLYTVGAFGDHHLVEIDPIAQTSRVIGSTQIGSFMPQILGLALYPPPPAPPVPPTSNGLHPARGTLYGSNRGNQNIVVVDKTSGAVSFDLGNHTMGVNNPQAVTFHPVTGVLYAIHDHFSASNNAALSTYDFTEEVATELCELPFGIVESVGGGNDTYGWGGLTFAPNSAREGTLFADGFENKNLCSWASPSDDEQGNGAIRIHPEGFAGCLP